MLTSLFAFAALTLGTAALQEQAQPADTRCYELRIYAAAPRKLEALNARFRDHTVKLFKKHGMTNIGYWVPADSTDNRLVYLLAYPGREARETSWKAFMADPEWIRARDASEVDGKLVEKVESIFLNATDYTPTIRPSAARKPRVFELRTYHVAPGKLDALNARFRDHTLTLIKKHGGTNFGYWLPTEQQQGAGNTLIYLLAFKDAGAQKKAWEEFGKDPEWIRVKAETEKDGKLVDKVDSTLLNPTDYSPTR